MQKTLRCIHRHTIDEHPQCFRRGLVKEPITEKQWTKELGNPWYTLPGTRIGYFDIETDGLQVDFSTMLSWAIKEKGGKTVTSLISKEDLFSGLSDRNLVESLLDEMEKYDILIGYYSDRFDMPYIRAKALHHELDFPGYGELYHWDLYWTIRGKLNLSRNSLDNACDYLGIKGKTPIEKDVWRRAKYADPSALKQVLAHNIADVEILEKLHDRVEFSRKWIKRSV